jgi:hypothetical protein
MIELFVIMFRKFRSSAPGDYPPDLPIVIGLFGVHPGIKFYARITAYFTHKNWPRILKIDKEILRNVLETLQHLMTINGASPPGEAVVPDDRLVSNVGGCHTNVAAADAAAPEQKKQAFL